MSTLSGGVLIAPVAVSEMDRFGASSALAAKGARGRTAEASAIKAKRQEVGEDAMRIPSDR
jgi:hypothetical protein